MSLVSEIIEPFSIFFQSGKYTTVIVQSEFANSEYYDEKNNTRLYDIEEYYNLDSLQNEKDRWKEETFEQFVSKVIETSTSHFKQNILGKVTKINSVDKQNAIIFGCFAHLQEFYSILSVSEDSSIVNLMMHIETSREFLRETFSEQLDKSDFKLPEKRKQLSSYFRGTEKLQFKLSKIQVTSLFLLLIDSGVLLYPSDKKDLAKFLDNNCLYSDRSTGELMDIKDSIVTISKAKNEDTVDLFQKMSEVLKSLRDSS